ncbi:universal stress protein [Tunicatimonas pelagia]|uniref:universal stress protein n=1 Tax=Tunicatimonas pelagia TaxID=931531 RepID=UPI0026669F8B|nr:universal stress protein [Tunicatimonas pelagia]WKN42120.1 universal stress protein [Tunicatimonas pelagia]
MKILVPIDFSADATRALRYAAALAQLVESAPSNIKFSSPELIILHVFQAPTGKEVSFFATSPIIERFEEETKKQLIKLMSTMPEVQSVAHRLITKLSMPLEGICDTIEDEKVDLVVMGGRGVNASANWLGSTTLQVMRNAPCPVLAVPYTTSEFHPQRIAFATDLEATQPSPSLILFKQLLQLWQAKVQVIHVHPHPATVSAKQAQEALQLSHLLKDVPHSYHFVEDKAPARGIEQYLQEHPADLLVVIPRHYAALESLFHKSVSKKLVISSSVPILSVHE